ncbi:hypothetical protein Acor_07830 [Acrocarpospora corrugata]|uniref:VCBS repeat-containing protein n=1 Tax=Acrocarpospora corrugata TaxID=35763 RepID=A0A5M3VVE7_9ACTN|nr:hypothetical protein [Acrocarpospora corrugata]GER98720.1 hypothetical protein Acor_07830 [Acrocarpospora corrugata]
MRFHAGKSYRPTTAARRRGHLSVRVGRALAIVLAASATMFTGGGKPAHATVPGFHNIQGSAAWTDFNGDGRADSCLVDIFNVMRCLLSTGSGFGAGVWAGGDLMGRLQRRPQG